MKKLITIAFLLAAIIAQAQVYTEVNIGEYAITTNDLGMSDKVHPKATRKWYAHTGSGTLIADTVFYVANGGTDPNISGVAAGKRVAILRQRTGVYTGTITASRDKVIYGSYGTGAKPKIYGSELITGWTLHSGSIYKKVVASNIAQLFINDTPAAISRYPETGSATVTTRTNATVFISTDIASQAADYYKGANAVLRGAAWRIQQKEITASTGQTLTITDSLTSATLTVNDEMFLINKLQWINDPGEWYFDDVANTVYAWMPNSDSPANYTIRGSVYNNGVDINSRSYVTIKNLDIQQQNVAGVNITTGDNNFITNNTISKVLGNGVYGTSSALNNEVSYNTIRDVYTIGISKEMAATNWNIHNNNISNIGFYSQLGLNQNSTLTPGTAIQSLSGNADINDNVIINVGYCGIRAENGTINIKRNYIKNALMVLDDGAAIYSFNMNAYILTNTKITDNIIDGAIGNPNGSDQTFKQGTGIYLDGGAPGALNVSIERNMIAHTTYGLYINSGNYRGIHNNTLYDFMYGVHKLRSPNDTVKNNNFYATNRRDTIVSFASGVHQKFIKDTSRVSVYNFNNYVIPYTETSAFVGFADFNAWKAANFDTNSVYDGTDMPTGHSEKLLYATSTSKTYYANGDSIKNIKDAFTDAAVPFPLTLSPYTSKVIIGSGANMVKDSIDITPPVINAFTVPSTSLLSTKYLTLAHSGGAIKYLITETNVAPSFNVVWKSFSDSTYVFSSGGTKTLYCWVVDAVGNISNSVSDVITVTNPLSQGLQLAFDMEVGSGNLPDKSGKGNITTNGGLAGYDPTNYNTIYTGVANSRFLTATSPFLNFFEDTCSIELNIYPTSYANAPLIFNMPGAFNIKISSSGYLLVSLIDSVTPANISSAYHATAVTLNAWNHFIITFAYDGTPATLSQTSIKIYRNNGAENSTVNDNLTVSNIKLGTSSLTMGGSVAYFNGRIGIFREWKDKMLTAADRSWLYKPNSSGKLTSTF